MTYLYKLKKTFLFFIKTIFCFRLLFYDDNCVLYQNFMLFIFKLHHETIIFADRYVEQISLGKKGKLDCPFLVFGVSNLMLSIYILKLNGSFLFCTILGYIIPLRLNIHITVCHLQKVPKKLLFIVIKTSFFTFHLFLLFSSFRTRRMI